MIYNKHILIIILLIIAIFLVYVLEIKSEQIALSILFATNIYVISGVFSNNKKCDDKGNSSSECLIGNTKSYAGLFDDGCLDVWHIKHALLWLLVGLLAPNYIKLVLVASIGYEISEHIVFKYVCDKQPIFCGRYEDIMINTCFYYFGSYLRNKQKEQNN